MSTTARLRFLDTSSRLSLAVGPDIEAAMLAEIGSDPAVVIDVVADEIEWRTTKPTTRTLAKTALARTPGDWIQMDTSGVVDIADIKQAQADVADGRVLSDEQQHWAESVIIALGRGRRSAKIGSLSRSDRRGW